MLEPTDIPDALAIWLLTACHDLNMEDDKRVRTEITAHFQDALAAGREAGLPGAEAERRAIAGLGNPNAARKRFTKAFGQEEDEKRINSLKEIYRTPRQMATLLGVYTALSFVFLIITALYTKENILYFSLLPLMHGGIALSVSFRAYWLLAALRKNSEVHLKRKIAFLYASITFLLAILVLAIFIPILHSVPRSEIRAIVISAMIFIFIFIIVGSLAIKVECTDYIRIMRKIRDHKLTIDEKGPDQYA